MCASHSDRSPGGHVRQPFGDRRPQVLRDRDVDADVLVELGAIDVDVNLARAEGVGLEIARHPVVEAHPERDEQVGLLDGGVHPVLAVHAHHPEIERVAGRHAADAEQRDRDGDPRPFGQREDLPLGAGEHHAVARQDQRPLGGIDERDRVAMIAVAGQRVVARFGEMRLGGVPVELAAGLLRVLGDVDQHGARTAARRDRERLADARRHVGRARHQVVVLGDRQRDAGDVGFLKGVRSDEPAADLPRDAHDRRRVHHGGRDAGDHVRRAGARGRDRDADAAARARIAVGHVGGALLVAHQHVADRIAEHRVVGRQDRAAGIAEDVGHSLTHQGFPDDLRTGQLHRRTLTFENSICNRAPDCASFAASAPRPRFELGTKHEARL